MMAGARSVIINLIANDRVTDTVKGIGKQFDKLNQQIGKMAAPAMAAAGAAAGGAFVAGIAGAIQLDSARGKLEAQLGLTKDQSKRVGDVAGRVFSQAYGESMEEVQTAITSVIQNMDGMRTASNAALEQTTKRAMDVATVMDEEVGGVTRAVSQIMRTGLAKNAQEAFDILTAGTQKGANKAQDLLDTFNEYSTQFRDLGLSGKQAMGLIQQGLSGGARDADTVADALKELNIRVQDLSAAPALKQLGLSGDAMAAAFGKGGPAAAKALDQIIDRLRAVKDPTDRYALSAQILGTKSEDMSKALLSLDPSSAAKALGQVGGAADRAGQALGGTAQARFTAFVRTLKQDVTAALGSTLGWFQQHTTVAKVLAAAVGTLVAAYLTYNAVALVMAARLALVTEGAVANTIVTKVAAAATKVWAATTWLLNGAMAVLTSPITLVVVAIGLLVAAVVLAYKKNETFRNIVNAVWAGIKTAIGAVWAFLKPIFSAIKNAIGVVLPIAMTFLRNVVKAVWIGIQIYIKVAWTLVRGYFMAIKAVLTTVVAPVFRWLWSNVVKPVWSGISAAIKLAWNSQIKPVFGALKSGVHLVAAGFRVAVDAIKKHWDRIKDISKRPVNFVLGVYNKGIVDVVNKISKFAGLDTRLNPIKLLEHGGTLANPAAARPMKTNGATAIVGEGKRAHPEYVIPTDPAYRKRAQALWAAAGQDLAGKGGGGKSRLGGEGMFFERGGIIGSFVKGLGAFNFLDPAKAFKGALSKLVGQVPGGGVFRDAVAGVPGKLIGYLVEWFKKKVGFGGGGAGVSKALSFAKAQDGKPYGWGAVGPGSYDCSGLWSALVNVIKGRNPYSRLFSTFGFTGASQGPEGFRRNANTAVRVGVTNAGVGHMAGTIRRTNIESSGSAGVRFGGGARGADDGLFNMRYGLKADTGALALAPGWNPPTFNGTGRMEYLETPRRGSDRPVEVVLQLDGRVIARQIVDPLRQDIGRNGGNVQNYLGKRS